MKEFWLPVVIIKIKMMKSNNGWNVLHYWNVILLTPEMMKYFDHLSKVMVCPLSFDNIIYRKPLFCNYVASITEYREETLKLPFVKIGGKTLR